MSIDSSRHEQLLHIRGYLERDLRPGSACGFTSTKRRLEMMGCNTEASGSTDPVAIDGPASLIPSIHPSEILRMSDIQNNSEFFLRPPRAPKAVVPVVRQYSKARSWPNVEEYMEPPVPRVIPPPPKSGASRRKATRHAARGGRWVST